VQLRYLRTAALITYVIAFIWSGVTYGIPTDRIAVLAWVLGGFVTGNLGKPRLSQLLMLRDFSLFVAMWFAYDYSRGIADQLGMPIQVFAPRNVDRFFFFFPFVFVFAESQLQIKHLSIPPSPLQSRGL
jgi:hypothetical protein